MRTSSIIRIFGLLLVTALMAAACGGGVSSEDQVYIDALVAEGNEELPPGVDANCLAEAFVTGAGGASRIQDTYGLSAAEFAGDSDIELTRGDAESVANNVWECDGFIDGVFSQIGDTDDTDEISCLRDNVDDDNLKTLFASDFMGEAGRDLEESVENIFEAELEAAFATCNIG